MQGRRNRLSDFAEISSHRTGQTPAAAGAGYAGAEVHPGDSHAIEGTCMRTPAGSTARTTRARRGRQAAAAGVALAILLVGCGDDPDAATAGGEADDQDAEAEASEDADDGGLDASEVFEDVQLVVGDPPGESDSSVVFAGIELETTGKVCREGTDVAAWLPGTGASLRIKYDDEFLDIRLSIADEEGDDTLHMWRANEEPGSHADLDADDIEVSGATGASGEVELAWTRTANADDIELGDGVVTFDIDC